MISFDKTKIVETIEKFDKDGNLIKKITKETNTDMRQFYGYKTTKTREPTIKRIGK